MDPRSKKSAHHLTQGSPQPAAVKHVKPGKADAQSSKAISKKADARHPHDRDGNEQLAQSKRR